ncbi:probable serine/threonine-protein kinase DDB_G0282963 isoform X2 [Anopheles darlingi]|uniref:probable serine/threonine-protein kinase DDB_G0282963 isoform X2 n=1 Tax=Anopheles darlingi TaxID=43151 RepID=UPI0021006755|nr:probable serine/threonine-protein kinase DDB_G0282963 isoform X2 [Anopheles darlingi]
MWNKLFKSKSKSSKNLSNRSCSLSGEHRAGSTSSQQCNAGVLVSSSSSSAALATFEQYGSHIELEQEPVRLRPRGHAHSRDENAVALDLATTNTVASRDQQLQQQQYDHRDSIGAQMCGIPMRRSKLSSAFKSFSLKRSASKSRLKLAPSATAVTDDAEPIAGTTHETNVAAAAAGVVPVGITSGEPSGAAGPWSVMDDYEILKAGKRASLRPCKSDNNLNEKQQYTEGEKEESIYIEECNPYEKLDIPCEPPPNLILRSCPICSRKFVPASLIKHIGICERVQTKKRKPFDSSRQRREGTELAAYLPKNFGLPHKTVSGSHEAIPVRKLSLSKTPTLERKEFAASTMSTSMPNSSSTPKPALKRSMSQQNEPCPYCERCFGMKAYDRHVEWCREKALLSKNVNNNQSISAAKERLQARIQYRAPQLRSKRAFNREKYSGSLSCGGSTNSLAELDLHMPRHNSMSSSVSSDKKSNPSTSLQPISLTIGNSHACKEAKANRQQREDGTRKVTKRTKTFTFSSDRLHSDSNNNCNVNGNHNHTGNRVEPAGGRTQTRNLLNRSTLDNATVLQHRHDKTRAAEQRIEKFEIIGHSNRTGERMTTGRSVVTQSVRTSASSSSGYSPDRYDPFLSARRQLEELFSPATSLIHTSSPASTTSTSRLNQSSSPGGGSSSNNDVKSPTSGNAAKTSPLNSNFRRAFSLRMPRKVSRPMYVEKAKSNIQKGITDDGPVSPNFLKSSEYDEIPIKSTFNALQMVEKPKLRDSSTVRKNLKLDLKDLNHPAITAGGTELPLSKTDSLAVFLKYETELALSEKDMKDKSNSISKRSSSLNAEAAQAKKQEAAAALPSCVGVHVAPVPKSEPATTVEPPEQKAPRDSPCVEESVARKEPLKLVPIRLEPINITYNDSNTCEDTTPKPTVISLDAIIGKSSIAAKPKLQYEKENRPNADHSYIDPKLINKCDNLPINIVKQPTKDVAGFGNIRNNTTMVTRQDSNVAEKREACERSVPPPPPPRATIKVVKKQMELARNENSSATTRNNQDADDDSAAACTSSESSGNSNSSSTTVSHSSSPVDNRSSEESTNGDKRPQLTRQHREDSGYRTGHDSEQDISSKAEPQQQLSKPAANRPTTPVAHTATPSREREPQTTPSSIQATNNLNRKAGGEPLIENPIDAPSSVGPSSPAPSARPREEHRPSVPALEDFDVDEFMASLENLHRRSPAMAKDYKKSLFSRASSTVSSGSIVLAQAASSKRSNSLDSGNRGHHQSSYYDRPDGNGSGVPRVDLRVRNGSGTASNHNNSSNSSSSISSPRHYGSSFNSNAYYSHTNNNNTTTHHNHSTSSNGVAVPSVGTINSPTTKASPSSDALRPLAQQRLNYAPQGSPIVSRRASQESSPYSPTPTAAPNPANSGGSSFQNLPNIHQTPGNGNGPYNNNNHAHPSSRPYQSSPSPVNGRSYIRHSNSPYHANPGTPTPSSTPLTGYFHHEPRYPAESFDHLERDLLKSVQELDRMCGSSSSVCSIDSEELYSVEDYPLHKRSSERSQASADSAYRSLSTQSPPDYAPPVPVRQGYPGSRTSTGAHGAQPPQSQDTTDNNAYNAHHTPMSLPPLTTSFSVAKGAHKMDGLSPKDSDSVPGLIMNPMSKFCHECGARFMISSAKFCMSCGVRRIMLE